MPEPDPHHFQRAPPDTAAPISREAAAGIRATGADAPLHVDPDFAREVLQDLYAYRQKRKLVAWALWAVFGWAGGHRFYLERPATGLLMLFTGGGGLVWWVVDGFLLNGMLQEHAAEQERRRRVGLPPLELAFMPALAEDVLSQPPAWTVRWRQRGRFRNQVRLAGDILVLLVAGTVLGSLAGARGGEEAVFAAVAVIVITLAGGKLGWMDRIPLARGLIRWSHRLRLFYYFNKPGGPPALLFRAVLGLVLAPFRRRERAEAMLYIQIGAVFTLIFFTLDVVEDVVRPLSEMGAAALAPLRLFGLMLREVLGTFVLIYVFVTPIGAVLTLRLLTHRTHTVPRILGAIALIALAYGLLR